MANGTYEIVIKNSTGGSTSNSPIANGSSHQEQKPTSDSKTNSSDSLTALLAADRFVMPFVEQAINYEVSTISLRTGSSELQQRVQFGLNVAKQAIGIGTTLITGFATGNPLLIVAGLISATTTAINYANQARTIKTESDLEHITRRGLNVRAGGYAPAYGASRTASQ